MAKIWGGRGIILLKEKQEHSKNDLAGLTVCLARLVNGE